MLTAKQQLAKVQQCVDAVEAGEQKNKEHVSRAAIEILKLGHLLAVERRAQDGREARKAWRADLGISRMEIARAIRRAEPEYEAWTQAKVKSGDFLSLRSLFVYPPEVRAERNARKAGDRARAEALAKGVGTEEASRLGQRVKHRALRARMQKVHGRATRRQIYRHIKAALAKISLDELPSSPRAIQEFVDKTVGALV